MVRLSRLISQLPTLAYQDTAWIGGARSKNNKDINNKNTNKIRNKMLYIFNMFKMADFALA
jgi:hypothetical protein